jgi:DNA-binding PadR family transcriptional regulator
MPKKDEKDELARWEINMRRGMLEMFVLAKINEKRHTYGWEIVQDLKKMTSDQLVLEDGTLYPLLHRMEKKGFVEGEWVRDATGSSQRPRKYYRITDYGKNILWQMLNAWERLVNMSEIILERGISNGSLSKERNEEVNYCPRCGSKQFYRGAIFCSDCGMNLQT